eukprot:CAMPEP_0168388272 /NCGR_PEP_ID=MMETSP0228-20121227/16368_1 /TAXON_ID=133427 /ORGANISM="Protoceratium reticulatum, Strain CCCM 535 (=CCMP 1889)" /LENGTH=341 /DNA_ID=CAMNT_0008401519 /DNA_START=21 /DNA_END=1047 /DNA_ORIENTATION=+
MSAASLTAMHRPAALAATLLLLAAPLACVADAGTVGTCATTPGAEGTCRAHPESAHGIPVLSAEGTSLMSSSPPIVGFKGAKASSLREDEDDSLLRMDDGPGGAEGRVAEGPRAAGGDGLKEATIKPSFLALSIYGGLFLALVGGRHLWLGTSVASGVRGEKDALQLAKPACCAREEDDEFGCTALHGAADRGAAAEVRELLAGGADANRREVCGELPLHFAARAGSAEACELLLAHGSEVNPVNEDGCTPLLLAARAGHEPACKLLLDRGGHAGGVADSELPPLLSALLLERIFEEGTGPKAASAPPAGDEEEAASTDDGGAFSEDPGVCESAATSPHEQ